jgi:stage V sporulation protein R
MELIDQHTKAIMEGCKERARQAGLKFDNETLEYIVTNRDLIELSPKLMIPTLYDYWVHDVEVLKEKGRYELYPSNPYETVINTKPAISFYNDNNPDWLNVMIFYHVLAHIDFFQNNIYFRHTWDLDFTGHALSDKRLIARLRSEMGYIVDYIIEFARGIDNLVGYFSLVSKLNMKEVNHFSNKLNYYFDIFLQTIKNVTVQKYLKEVDRYNECLNKYNDLAEESFFSYIVKQFPEFETLYEKFKNHPQQSSQDLVEFILNHSPFLKKEENNWMKSIIQVVHHTSLFFQPQIRTKIMNEGWASYWHEKLFLSDERIKGHEVDFARVHSGVTTLPRVGLNPYALGMRLFYDIEEKANKGKLSFEFDKIKDINTRSKFNKNLNSGNDFIFHVRENLSDYLFINTFVDQDFVDKNNLFVAGKRLNSARMVWEYYVKSRKARDYKDMLRNSLYHPPAIRVLEEKTNENLLYLVHEFEGKPLVKDYIPNTMIGIEYLWGAPVKLETTEVIQKSGMYSPAQTSLDGENTESDFKYVRVLYIMEKRKLSKITL